MKVAVSNQYSAAAKSAAAPNATITPGGDMTPASGAFDTELSRTSRSTGHTEYFSISPLLYSFPVSVRGNCVS
ncbi:MAG TPA: hypothetical protein VFI55_01635, partial [Mycobacterium sp.]|nr:hypothetical protein [Mycobacterium sp.]